EGKTLGVEGLGVETEKAKSHENKMDGRVNEPGGRPPAGESFAVLVLAVSNEKKAANSIGRQKGQQVREQQSKLGNAKGGHGILSSSWKVDCLYPADTKG